jgi:hypothetical protein
MVPQPSFTIGQITLAGLLGGLLGGVVGSLLTHWLAERRDRKKEFRDAGRQFREAFLEVERLLSIRHPMHANLYSGAPQEYQDIIELLPRHYQQQYTALLKFEPYLSKSNQDALRRMWNEYCCFDPIHKYPTFSEYDTRGNHEIEMQNRDIVLKRIEKMFEYTR